METTIAFFHGIMASLPNFKISPGMPSDLTDFFLPITGNHFLITLIQWCRVYLILLIEFVDYYVHNRNRHVEFREVDFYVGSVMSLP